MFERISRGWQLTKTAAHVLRLDPEIMWLPILSAVVQIVAVVGVGVLAFGLTAAAGDVGFYLGLFLVYVAAYTVVIFFNAAVIEMARIRFSGGDPVVRDGLRKSMSRLGRILQWALVAATVGVLLNALRSQARDNLLARLLVGFLEFGWNVATYFVVPVLVVQDMGPIDAIKESTRTVKRVWGESLTGVVTTGFVFFLLGLLGFVPLLIGLLSGSFVVMVALAVLAVLYWIVLAAASSAISGILVAALYEYGRTGELPQAFRDEGVEVRGLAF